MPRSPNSPPSTSPETDGISSERTLFVVFCDADVVPWWMKPFVTPGFEHCFTLAQVGPVACVVEQVNYAILQHTYWQTLELPEGAPVAIYGCLDVEDLALKWAGEGYVVVRIRTCFSYSHRVWRACNLLPTCVSLCKNLLGVKCAAQTPLQLYRWLLANGGELVEDTENGRRTESAG